MDAVGQGRRLCGCLGAALAFLYCGIGGCGELGLPSSAPLFTVPLSVEGREVSPAVLDTGGGYELLLRDDFGLPLMGRAEVLAFSGRELVEMTGGFQYQAGGIEANADFALVGVSVCDCNGVGFHFFRKTGVVLGLDFGSRRASFFEQVPEPGSRLAFTAPPEMLRDFQTSFILIEVGEGHSPPEPGEGLTVAALLDTGSNITAMQRGLVGSAEEQADRIAVTLTHPALGTLGASVVLFDTPGLPSVILGTDAMSAWGERWYFAFHEEGGTVTVAKDFELLSSDVP